MEKFVSYADAPYTEPPYHLAEPIACNLRSKNPRLVCPSYQSGDSFVFAFPSGNLMGFSQKSYIFLKRQGEANGKGNALVLTLCGDGTPMELHNLLGNGQAQTGPAGGSASRRI